MEEKQELVPYKEYEHNDFIVKSNIIISGKYKATLQALRVSYLNQYKIQNGQYREDPETKELIVDLYPTEISRMIGLKKGTSLYKSLESIAVQMVATFIGISDPMKERFEYISVVTHSTYEDGVLTTRYNPAMKKFLMNLKQNFTKLPRGLMMSWKTIYAYRMYEILKQRAFYPNTYTGVKNGIFSVTYDVYELRLLLGVVNSNLEAVKRVLNSTNPPDYKKACEVSPEKLYQNWRDLKKSVIDAAVNEINENEEADINVKYETLKKAHNEIYAVKFTIYLKSIYQKVYEDVPEVPLMVDRDGEVKQEGLTQQDKFIVLLESSKILGKYNLQSKDYISICEAAGYDMVIIKKAEELLSRQKEVKNVVGWLINAIKNGYEAPVEYHEKKEGKSPFHQFEQKQYDFADLEQFFETMNGFGTGEDPII